MNDGYPAERRPAPRVRTSWVVATGAVIVALVFVGIVVVQQVSQRPPANPDYSVTLAAGVRPTTPNGRIAAIARRYLEDQTPELAAPGIHQPPMIISATVTLAREARRVEPGIPDAQVASQPERIGWIVRASGDFLNLHDLPWSSQGTPYPGGNIVIDDATGTILGVYPRAPGT
jgi:hypothetical protein